ncbi:MAG: hypothetical protein RJB24_151 [Candidatus Parcubacteria bacterium]|jgi:hypothetical protein
MDIKPFRVGERAKKSKISFWSGLPRLERHAETNNPAYPFTPNELDEMIERLKKAEDTSN